MNGIAPPPEASWRPHEREAQPVADLLRVSRLTVLVGPAGAGKTALLREGVLPLLRRRAADRPSAGPAPEHGPSAPTGHRPERRGPDDYGCPLEVAIVFDDWGAAPVAALLEQIAHALPGAAQAAVAPRSGLSANLEAWSRARGVRFLILLDQFERLLHEAPDHAGARAFVDEMVRAVNAPSLPANFLIALDEQAETLLAKRLGGRLRGLDDSRLRLPGRGWAAAAPAWDDLPGLPAGAGLAHRPTEAEPAHVTFRRRAAAGVAGPLIRIATEPWLPTGASAIDVLTLGAASAAEPAAEPTGKPAATEPAAVRCAVGEPIVAEPAAAEPATASRASGASDRIERWLPMFNWVAVGSACVLTWIVTQAMLGPPAASGVGGPSMQVARARPAGSALPAASATSPPAGRSAAASPSTRDSVGAATDPSPAHAATTPALAEAALPATVPPARLPAPPAETAAATAPPPAGPTTAAAPPPAAAASAAGPAEPPAVSASTAPEPLALAWPALPPASEPPVLEVVVDPTNFTDVRVAHELARAVAPALGYAPGVRPDLPGTPRGAAALLAIVNYDVLQAAAKASPRPATRARDAWRVVMPLYTEEIHFLVRSDSPLEFIHQIEGARINLGPAGAPRSRTAAAVYERLFGAPVAPERASLSGDTEALGRLVRDRTLDAMVVVGAQPAQWLAQLDAQTAGSIRLLRLDAAHPASQRAIESYLPTLVRAASYGAWLREDVPTLATMSFLATPGQAEPAAAERLARFTQALCRELPALRRTGHPKWREVQPGLALDAGVTYAESAEAALQACAGQPATRDASAGRRSIHSTGGARG